MKTKQKMNQKKLRRTHLKKEKKIVARKIKEETKIETKTKPKRKIKKIFEYLNKDKKNVARNQGRCRKRKFRNALSKCWSVPSC